MGVHLILDLILELGNEVLCHRLLKFEFGLRSTWRFWCPYKSKARLQYAWRWQGAYCDWPDTGENKGGLLEHERN